MNPNEVIHAAHSFIDNVKELRCQDTINAYNSIGNSYYYFSMPILCHSILYMNDLEYIIFTFRRVGALHQQLYTSNGEHWSSRNVPKNIDINGSTGNKELIVVVVTSTKTNTLIHE